MSEGRATVRDVSRGPAPLSPANTKPLVVPAGPGTTDAGVSERCVAADVGGKDLGSAASERPAAVSTLVPPICWTTCRRGSSASPPTPRCPLVCGACAAPRDAPGGGRHMGAAVVRPAGRCGWSLGLWRRGAAMRV
nr:unnamed protein product [Leishmania braziliensis]